jgi:hypothetical protein
LLDTCFIGTRIAPRPEVLSSSGTYLRVEKSEIEGDVEQYRSASGMLQLSSNQKDHAARQAERMASKRGT